MRLLVLCTLLIPSVAFAHIDLLDPPSRERRQKDGPCGSEGSTPGPVVATFEAGSTIEIDIDETIDHPGHYRVAIDLDGGDDNLADAICLTNCDDNRQGTPTFEEQEGVTVLGVFEDDDAAAQTLTVTLPDVACERCTLQITQIMYDKRPITLGGNDVYYRCADIELTRAAPPADAGVDAGEDDAGPMDDAGADDAGVLADAGAMDAAPATDASSSSDAGAPGDDGGCSITHGSSAPPAALILLLIVGWVMRRRSSQDKR